MKELTLHLCSCMPFRWFYLTLYKCFGLSIDIPSVMQKRKTPSQNKVVMRTSKCVIPLEPLVFNGNSGTPMKRRASHSIPDESSVTSKKSRGSQSVKNTKGIINSPSQRYGMIYGVLYSKSCTLHRNCYLGQKILTVKNILGKKPYRETYLT